MIDSIVDAVSFKIVDGDYYRIDRLPNVSVHGPVLVNHYWFQTETSYHIES